MRVIIYGAFIFFFLATPVYLFETLVMPSLTSMQYTYAHADGIAAQIANGGVAK